MSFTSELGSMPIIDSNNYKDFIDVSLNGVIMGRGLVPRDFSTVPRGSLPYSARYKLPNWSRAEIKERIKDNEAKKARLTDLCDYNKLSVKYQGRTNYCWVYAPVHCMEIVGVKQGNKYVDLSPESVGGPVTRYQNVGNFATYAIDYIVANGVVPRSMWPQHQINAKYMTEQAKVERQKYKISEVWELEYKNFEQLCICLLLGYPVAIGLDWWRHEVTCLDPVILKNGGLGVVINNSWGTGWGDKGRGVLTESQALGDMFAPRVITA